MMIWSTKDLSDCLEVDIPFGIYGERIQFNSTSIVPGDLFIALKGNRDGHEYVSDALSRGANAAIVSCHLEKVAKEKVIMVPDTFQALQKMAEYKRNKSHAIFIAVTGSSGKTGTKEAIKTILSHFGPTFASRGNFNNYLGLPINLASMPDNIEYAVFELGMNHAGEIRELTKMVKPNISVITTISEAHLEFFESGLEIADAKCEVFEGMSKSDIAIINIDNKYYQRVLHNLNNLSMNNIFTFGTSPEANARLVSYKPQGDEVHLQYSIASRNLKMAMPLIPMHYAINYAAILQVISVLNKDLGEASRQLAGVLPTEGRGLLVKAEYNNLKFDIICDYYNANPESLTAALLFLKQLSGRKKVAIIGDMLELGKNSASLHQALVPAIMEVGLTKILLVGANTKYIYDLLPTTIEKHHFDNVDILINQLSPLLGQDELLLIKGSRGIKLDKIIQIFKILQ